MMTKKQMCMRSVADHILNRMVRRTKEMGNSLEKSVTRQHEQLPLQLGVGLTVHHLTRSKELISFLHSIGICAHYQAVLKTENEKTESLLEKRMVDGIFVPNGIQKNRFVSLQLIILTC
jgi:glutamate-1-semialdehyde aminotransferase